MQGLPSTSALLWAPEKVGVRQPRLILSPCLGTPELPPRMQGLRSISALFWAPEKARLRLLLLILSPLLGTPKNVGVTQHFRPLLGPREGKVKVATSDFVPFVGDPLRMQGLHSTSALFWAPEKAGVRQYRQMTAGHNVGNRHM